MPDIAGLNGGLVKATPDLTDLLPIQDTQGVTRPTSISGVVAKALGSSGFPAAVQGVAFGAAQVAAIQAIVNAMIVGGTGVIVTYNTTTNKISIATSQQVGDPLSSSVVLLMPMTTASGITDIKGKVTTNQGSTPSTARNDPFGNNVGVRDFAGAGARISVAQSNDFAFGSGAFAIEMWLYPTSIPSGNTWGILDTRPVAQLSDWVVAGNGSGSIGFTDFSYQNPYYEFTSSPIILNQWNYVCVSRTATENHKIWINGVLFRTASTRSNAITASGNLLVGDQSDTAALFDGSFTGSMSNLRITRAYRDGSVIPTAAFPTN